MGRGGENFENFECCLKSMVYGSRVPKVLDLYHVCIYVNHYKQRVCGHSNFAHIPASFGTMPTTKIHFYSPDGASTLCGISIKEAPSTRLTISKFKLTCDKCKTLWTKEKEKL